jgi:hypothetical protein
VSPLGFAAPSSTSGNDLLCGLAPRQRHHVARCRFRPLRLFTERTAKFDQALMQTIRPKARIVSKAGFANRSANDLAKFNSRFGVNARHLVGGVKLLRIAKPKTMARGAQGSLRADN